MSLDQWILALHVLSAFALVAALVLFWVMIVAVRRTDTPEGTIRMAPVAKVGNAAAGIGGVGTIVFGVWLAFSVGGYDIWDGWIIAAIVLWFVATGVGGRTGKEYMAGMKKAEELQAALDRAHKAAGQGLTAGEHTRVLQLSAAARSARNASRFNPNG